MRVTVGAGSYEMVDGNSRSNVSGDTGGKARTFTTQKRVDQPCMVPECAGPSTLYVSYDGMLEPLGESQVLGYLERLADQFAITLMSFEKRIDLDATQRVTDLARRLRARGIRWIPLRYHKWPPVVSTCVDVLRAVLRGRRQAREGGFSLIHARGYVAGLIGVMIARGSGAAFLFDMRGFWADEKVDGGHWSRSSPVYAITKRCERLFFESAQGIVSLTRAGAAAFPDLGYRISSGTPVEVIPTCTDLEQFTPGPRDDALACELGLTDYTVIGVTGTISNWYLRQAMLDGLAFLTRTLDRAKVLIVTREDHARLRTEAIAAGLSADRIVLASAPFASMPRYLRLMDVGLFFIKPCFSKKGSCATKLGEFLATGTPVVINDGIGDSGQIVRAHRAGLVLPEATVGALRKGMPDLTSLLTDPTTSNRCRAAARAHFDIERGSEKYAALYQRLAVARGPTDRVTPREGN